MAVFARLGNSRTSRAAGALPTAGEVFPRGTVCMPNPAAVALVVPAQLSQQCILQGDMLF